MYKIEQYVALYCLLLMFSVVYETYLSIFLLRDLSNRGLQLCSYRGAARMRLVNVLDSAIISRNELSLLQV